MNTFPKDFVTEHTLLDTNLLSAAGQNMLSTLSEKGFAVRVGLTTEDTRSLSQLSLQQSIREYCPNDCTKRFKDLETTREWLRKGRETFLLVDTKTEAIAGYGWIGPGTSELVPSGT